MIEKKESVKNEVDRAFNFLREKTVNFGFEPGVRINEVKLASTLGMSRAPVREALNRLVAMELVVFKPGKGFFCRKLSIVEVAELLEIRSDLELSSLRTVCRKATDEDIRALHEKCKNTHENQAFFSVDSLVELDEKFHIELLELANNSERVKYMKNINERIRFVRQIHLETEEQRLKFISDHVQILEALKNRDEKQAIHLMETHLRTNSEDLRAIIREGLERIYGDDIGL